MTDVNECVTEVHEATDGEGRKTIQSFAQYPQLSKLVDWMREYGIEEFQCPAISLKLGPAPTPLSTPAPAAPPLSKEESEAKANEHARYLRVMALRSVGRIDE